MLRRWDATNCRAMIDVLDSHENVVHMRTYESSALHNDFASARRDGVRKVADCFMGTQFLDILATAAGSDWQFYLPEKTAQSVAWACQRAKPCLRPRNVGKAVCKG